MTVCLTFDDGFKVHYDIAAPMLEKYGWQGAFNVPTAFMDESYRLTSGQLWDCRLVGNENNRMDWADVADLLRRGHEVYPHGVDHSDPGLLERADKLNQIVLQVCESKRRFVEKVGTAPLFFCPPHNSTSNYIRKTIREHGMELFNCSRVDCGGRTVGGPDGPMAKFLRRKYYAGCGHLDLMVHGIGAKFGGWNPFVDVESFRSFLDEIASVEKEGLIRVVKYADSHWHRSFLSPALYFADRVVGRIRREIFTRIYHRAH